MAARVAGARLYHSVALLMPDGKVVTAGSNPQRKTEELRIEVFWPPYLFGGARPACTPAADRGALRRGPDRRRARAPRRVASACLIRPGATTHSMDSEQRLVDLPLPGDAAPMTADATAAIRDADRAAGLVPAVRASSADGVPSEAAGST